MGNIERVENSRFFRPDTWRVNKVIKDQGLKKVNKNISFNLIKDLAELFGGGKIKDIKTIDKELDNYGFTPEQKKAYLNYETRMNDFLNAVKDEEIWYKYSGRTMLDKVGQFLTDLYSQHSNKFENNQNGQSQKGSKGQSGQDSGSGSGGGDNDSSEENEYDESKEDHSGKIDKNIKEMFDQLKDDIEMLEGAYSDNEDLKQDAEMYQSMGGGKGTGTQKGQRQQVKIGGLTMTNEDLKEIVEIAKNLEEIVPFEEGVTEVKDPTGNINRYTPIKAIDELMHTKASTWATYAEAEDYFMYQLTQQNILTKERFSMEDKKQFIYIIIDGSGSMGENSKIQKAIAICINRLYAVADNKAVVWVSSFDTNLKSGIIKAENKSQVAEAVKKVCANSYNGGGTNIAVSLLQARDRVIKEMESNPNLIKPEMFVISDGDYTARNINYADYVDFTVHGFSLDEANPDLVKFCHKTGGVGKDNF